jgi:hypothetical protein
MASFDAYHTFWITTESPKDIIELSKSIYQMKIRGEWHLSETTLRVRKLFEKLGIDYLNLRS